MIETARQIRTHLLPWTSPLPAQAAEWLAGAWNGGGALDLQDVLVVVPTRQSGRRLRSALAGFAAAKNSAVLAPRVVEAKDLVALELPDNTATSQESRLAWIRVLRAVALHDYRAVFPVDPPARDFAWSMRLASQLSRLQSTLAETGLRIADVRARAGEDFPEIERWEQLARLENAYDDELGRAGLRDPQRARIEFARSGRLPAQFRRVAVIGAPDPMPLALLALDRISCDIPVDIVCYGADLSAFDGFGRPIASAWNRVALDFARQVHLCADPAEQAVRVKSAARRYPDPGEVLAIGVGDPDLANALEHELLGASIEPFNPEGKPLRQSGLFALLAALAELANDASFQSVQALARCPDFLLRLRGRVAGLSTAGVLAELDDLHTDHLPGSIEQANRHTAKRPAAGAALEFAQELRDSLQKTPFPENCVAALQRIFQGGDRAVFDEARKNAAEAWMDAVREIASALGALNRGAAPPARGDFTNDELWQLALATFGETRTFDERPPKAVDLVGWLELLWEDAPHVIAAGMNDGRVPDAVVGDVFLPEALREKLGLKSNDARLARDAYILSAIAASRKGPMARLDLLVGKTGIAGDPLRPSRLFFLCDDEELPPRVAALFRELEPAGSTPAWRRAWKLAPRIVPPLTRVSVTAFRDYLRCPFRFYLKHALRMETIDPHKSEMDAFDFGHLCHAALEAMGRETALRDCADAATLREFLLTVFNQKAREQFGAELTLPLIVQLESARQRLSRAAEIQAEQRAAGWVIERLEHPFDLPLGGLTVRGRIDRIERNERTGIVRVIDYKTSDMPKRPRDAHVRRPRADESVPEWARFTVGDEELVWVDLQLPLYLEALAAEFGVAVQAGYFNLPKAVGDTALCVWDEFDATYRAAARRCAEGIAQAQVAGIFWPPLEIPARNEDEAFAGLFHHGTADSIEWKGTVSPDGLPL